MTSAALPTIADCKEHLTFALACLDHLAAEATGSSRDAISLAAIQVQNAIDLLQRL